MRFVLASVVCGACAAPATVELELATQPDAIAFRADGDSAWVDVAERMHSERSAVFDVPARDGTLAVACTRADGSVQVEELLATADDLAREFYAAVYAWPQLDCPGTDEPVALVAGNMVQGGDVYIGTTSFSGFGPWAFAGPVTAGVHDVVAVSGFAVLVRHDQPMLATYAEPVIDIGEGSDLDVDTLQGSDGSLLGGLETVLTTVNGTVASFYGFDVGEAYVVPDAQLELGDTQLVYAMLDDDTYGVFMPPLAGVAPLASPTVDGGIAIDTTDLRVDLSALALDDTVDAVRLDIDGGELALAATATKAWLAAHGAALAIDTSFPDFHWKLSPPPGTPSPSDAVSVFDRAPTSLLTTYIAQ